MGVYPSFMFCFISYISFLNFSCYVIYIVVYLDMDLAFLCLM